MSLDFISDKNNRIMFGTAMKAINQLELWDFVKEFNDSTGFSFAQQPEIERIYNHITEVSNYHDHSGTSFAYTMRAMQCIATHGFEFWRTSYIENKANK